MESGFERYEADAAVIDDGPHPADPDSSSLFGKSVAEVVTTRPAPEAFAALPREVREAVRFEKRADSGETELVWNGGLLTSQQAEKLATLFIAPEDQRAVQKIVRRSEGRDDNSAAFGDHLDVPQLAVADASSPDGWALFDIGDREIEWSLSDCDAEIGEDALNPAMATASGALIDVAAAGKVAVELLTRLQEQTQLGRGGFSRRRARHSSRWRRPRGCIRVARRIPGMHSRSLRGVRRGTRGGRGRCAARLGGRSV